MIANFINCNKCGTRNFSDDKICGVCKSRLLPKTKQSINFIEPKSQSSIRTWVIVILISLVSYYFLFGSERKEAKEHKTVFNSSWNASVFQVEDYLKFRYLKDPDSYESISWSEVSKLNDTKQIGFGSFQVRHKFRAKNSFNGFVVEEKLFKLDFEGNIVEIKDYLH
jgi:hypothetical protein